MIEGIVDFVLPGSLHLVSVELFHKYGNVLCVIVLSQVVSFVIRGSGHFFNH